MKKAFLAALALSAVVFLPSAANAQETQCDNGIDDDGDTVYDCGDNDCANSPLCKKDGNPENSNKRCGDWIDNDGDGQTDCDDSDCYGMNISICEGSWDKFKRQSETSGSTSEVTDDIPELGAGMSVEDLIGVGSDADGERNDVVCSDGIDNDNDGRTDCADFGCRFDPTVTVCQGDASFRFSVVARGEQSYTRSNVTRFRRPTDTRALDNGELPSFADGVLNTKIERLQLRVFGPMPGIDDSFFLISARAEKTPRVSFVMFQVPLGKNGHYLNFNSGGGGLTIESIRSAHKNLLLTPAFYVANAFEQGNGAAVEVGGPIGTKGKYQYRVFAAGGTGRFSGSVGGGFVNDDNRNYTYSTGGQVQLNLIGYHNRWDSSMLFTKSPTTLSLSLGVKYDQRSQERYPAFNTNATFKWRNLIVLGESNVKYELDFKSVHASYNLKVGYLVIPKKLLLAADFGEFLAVDQGDVPSGINPEQERQIRAAAHYYLWRNIVVGSLFFSHRNVAAPANADANDTGDRLTQEIKASMSYRF